MTREHCCGLLCTSTSKKEQFRKALFPSHTYSGCSGCSPFAFASSSSTYQSPGPSHDDSSFLDVPRAMVVMCRTEVDARFEPNRVRVGVALQSANVAAAAAMASDVEYKVGKRFGGGGGFTWERLVASSSVSVKSASFTSVPLLFMWSNCPMQLRCFAFVGVCHAASPGRAPPQK